MPRDYLKPSVQGIGFLGERVICTDLEYIKWASMFKRCYSKAVHSRRPSYIGCSVVEEWHDFRNFKKWIRKQRNWNVPGFELDKDLRVLVNKTYGPQFCSFVPVEVNAVFGGAVSSRYGLGVTKRGRRFLVVVRRDGKQVRLPGSYLSQEDAQLVALQTRVDSIRELARLHKANLHREVFSNLVRISVEEVELLHG